MSRPRIRTLAVIVGATALVGAAGCGAASSSNSSTPPAGQRPNLSAMASAPSGTTTA